MIQEWLETFGRWNVTSCVISHDEAMKNGSAREGEDGEEERTHHICNNHNKEGWEEGLLNISVFCLDDQYSDIAGDSHDGSFSEHHHNPSNDSC